MTPTQPYFCCILLLFSPLLVLSYASTPSSTPPSKQVTFWNSGSCPYAQRAWIALKEKGIEFEYKKVDLQNKEATPAFGDAYSKANPNKLASSKVPVLEVTQNGETSVYTESKVLLQVIEEIWPEPPLLPEDVTTRYRSRVFSEVVYENIFGGNKSPYKLAMRKIDAQQQGEWDQQDEIANLCESLSVLDHSLREFAPAAGPFVCGDAFTLAECTTGPFVQRADAVFEHYLGINVVDLCRSKGYERAALWWKSVLERKSLVETGISPEQTIEGTKRIIDMMRAARM